MDFFSQLLDKQQTPPRQSAAQKKHLTAAKEAEDARKKYLANYRSKATDAVNDFAKDASRLRMKFAPAEKAVRGIIHELAEQNGLISHSFGEEGLQRYVYIYKKEYNLTDAELICYSEGRKWNPGETVVVPEKSQASTESVGSTPPVALRDPETSHSNRKRLKITERELVRMTAENAAVVRISRESFGNVPVSVMTDKRTMAQVQSDIQAKKRVKSSQDSTDA